MRIVILLLVGCVCTVFYYTLEACALLSLIGWMHHYIHLRQIVCIIHIQDHMHRYTYLCVRLYAWLYAHKWPWDLASLLGMCLRMHTKGLIRRDSWISYCSSYLVHNSLVTNTFANIKLYLGSLGKELWMVSVCVARWRQLYC